MCRNRPASWSKPGGRLASPGDCLPDVLIATIPESAFLAGKLISR